MSDLSLAYFRMKWLPAMSGLLTLSLALMPIHVSAFEVDQPAVVDVKKWCSKKVRKYETITLGHLKSYTANKVALSQYGGRKDRRADATGFFRVAKVKQRAKVKQSAREGTQHVWTFIDPEGYHYIDIGVNSVASHASRKDSKPAFKSAFEGDNKQWALATDKLLFESAGFRSLACWSDWRGFKEAGIKRPYTRRWNFMSSFGKKKKITYKKYGHAGFPNDCIPVFDPDFEAHANEVAKGMAETKDDPWLLGHFSDNELPLKQDKILSRYLDLPKEDHGHQAALKFLKDQGISQKKITRQHDEAFCRIVLDRYYRIVSQAMKRVDPNHLYIGTRVHGGVSKQPITYEVSGKYVDVVSINYYHRWTPEHDLLLDFAARAGKPLLITEWYAKGEDSGLLNEAGAGFTVKSQAARGQFYENFTLGLLRHPSVVGWHWFRYIDDGPSLKGNASNKGLLQVNYAPYVPLLEATTRINHEAYGLRDYLLGKTHKHWADEPKIAS